MTISAAPGRDQWATDEVDNICTEEDPTTHEVVRPVLAQTDPAAFRFVQKVVNLGAAIWVAAKGSNGSEFYRPLGWQKLTGDSSGDPIGQFQPGMALCVNTGGVMAVVDVDPRNGGDIEKVRRLLGELRVRVFAEVTTPSGGKHFYIAGHRAMPTVHSTMTNGKLPGFPGVDVQSFGANVFLPGTQRPKYHGAGYTIDFEDLDAMADGGDPVGGESFSRWVADSQAQNTKKRAGRRSSCFTLTEAGPGNGVSPDARQQAYLGKVLQNQAKTVAEARDGGRNNAVFSAALQCGSFVAGAGMDESALVATLEAAADKCGLVEDGGPKQVLDTIRSGLQRGKQNPRGVPPGSSGGLAEDSRSDGDGLQRLEDAHIGQRIADDCLMDRFLYSAAFGWMRYDGRRWKPVDDTMVGEVVRQGLIEFHTNEAQAGADADRLKRISGLLSAHKLKAILWVAKCYLSVEDADFDAHPDLLNVRNGVVDLRDGRLRPHDPVLRFTKVTMVDYVLDAVHPDWQQALTAVPNDAVDWMHVRLGQGLTGYPAPDDVLVVLKGSGENGKSTLLDSVLETVGLDYAVPLPDRVLLARNGDHPTELMTLRGARLAFMEEFPEIGHLNVKRLKATQGTFQMSARYIGKDTVCWTATHSMFVTTNYLPRVDESDHGTWRRLALVEFPFRYRKPHEILMTDTDRPGDPGLRDRMRRGGDGRSEAVLSWLIKGAVNWYHNERMMPPAPPSVLQATREWRRCSDLLLRYMEDNLVFDANAHVMARELFSDFKWWLKVNGHVGWTDQNFSSRLAQRPDVLAAGVGKKRGVREACPGLSRRRNYENYEVAAPKQYAAWMGLRFRVPEDAQG